MNLSKEERGKVEEYADNHNLTMPQAYGELVRKALENQGFDVDRNIART